MATNWPSPAVAASRNRRWPRFGGKYYLTLRNDVRGYVTTSDDGLHFAPVKAWTFDDGQDLGSYNTQAHWLTHSDGLFLTYTRRGADNDHIALNPAPLLIAQVDPQALQVIRTHGKVLLPERGVMLGNFGAAAVTANESLGDRCGVHFAGWSTHRREPGRIPAERTARCGWDA